MRDFNHLAAVRPLAARLADRDRRCFVCANGPPEPGFFLWLVDDGGALEIVERVDDPKVAEWLAQLVNEAIAAERGKREARP